MTRRARLRASLEPGIRRILAGISAATAAIAHVPPAWRRPRRLMLMGALLLVAIALIVSAWPTTPRHLAPRTKVFQIDHRVALRFVHSTGSVREGRAGWSGQHYREAERHH